MVKRAVDRKEVKMQKIRTIPILPRSGNYLEDCEDDRLTQEEMEDKFDQAEDACDDR